MLTAEELMAVKDRGFEVIADAGVVLIGKRMVRLRIPTGLTRAEARERINNVTSTIAADLNHYHRPEKELGPPNPRGWHDVC
jgi:hypothetical protein